MSSLPGLLADAGVLAPLSIYNQFAQQDEMDLDPRAAAGRCERLSRHLDIDPKLILIAEAAGYQGCRYSGVTFTSERLISEGQIPRTTPQRLTTRSRPWSEPSATIVWSALYRLGLVDQVIMWNTLPFHPHKPGSPLTNRTPTDQEIDKHGLPYMEILAREFRGTPLVAVGKKAEGLMAKLGIKPAACVRHPANGGARQFFDQLKDYVSFNNRS